MPAQTQVLLLKDVRKLGHLGDVVTVKSGYARNFLLPQRLATAPTEANMKAIEEDKKRATADRARRNREFVELVEKMKDVSVTIEAAANPEGTLYGSVGPKQIAEALQKMGHPVLTEYIMMDVPIRTLDNKTVTVEFTDEIATRVKVWVVREGPAEQADESTQPVESGEESGA